MKRPVLEEIRPLLTCIPLLAALSAATSAQMGEDPPPPVTPVAKLRFTVPEVPASLAPDFVIHGTIPLPPGTYIEGDPVPFKLVDYTGALVDPTQLEVVSRYPDAVNDGVDVVELSARIPRNPSWVAGKRKVADVVIAVGSAPPDPGTPDIQDLVNGPTAVPTDIQVLLSDPYSIALVGLGPQGEKYYCFPLDGSGTMRTDRHGPVRSGLRVYQTLTQTLPIPPGDLPTLMGAHVYLETVGGENALRFNVRFNNAPDGALESSPLDNPRGEVFFDQLSLYLKDDPAYDWTALQQFVDPYGITPSTVPAIDTVPGSTENYRVYPLVSPLPGDQSHVMFCRNQFFRRLVIAPAAEFSASTFTPQRLLVHEGQAFSKWGTDSFGDPLWSWWSEETERYFAQRHRLAKLSFSNSSYSGGSDMRSTLSSWYSGLRSALANETAFNGPFGGAPAQYGWARPLGDPYGGTAGGGGIQFLDGDRTAAVASLNGYRYLMLRHRLCTERMPNVLYGAFGEHTTYDTWTGTHSSGETYFRIQAGFQMDFGPNDSFFCPSVPLWNQNAYIASVDGKPFYYNDLKPYAPVDAQHLCRYTSMAKALSWLGNDPLAKDDVLAQAELFRMTFSEHPNVNGNSVGWSLSGKRESVGLDGGSGVAGWGFDVGRGEGWGLDVANAAFAMQDDGWRNDVSQWYDKTVELFYEGHGATTDVNYVDENGDPRDWGFWIAKVSDKLYGFGAGVRARQNWEELILDTGLRGIRESVYSPGTSNHADLSEVIDSSLFGVLAPVAWNENLKIMWDKAPVTPNPYPGSPIIYNCDPTIFSCTGQFPLPAMYPPYGIGSAAHYMYSAMGDGFETTGDELFLRRAHLVLTGSPCSTNCAGDLKDALEDGDPTSGYSEWSNKVHLLGLLQ
ncbi:MAG: hypothetical protein AAF682_02160 [Planctomycetota bacterium]